MTPGCGGTKPAVKPKSNHSTNSGGYRPKSGNPFGGGGSFGTPKVKTRFGSRSR